MSAPRIPNTPGRRFRTRVLRRLLPAVGAVALLAGEVQAQIIVGYNITNARGSSFGGWSHSYNGTISAPDANGLRNYSGGTQGSLNNLIVSNTISNNHLFETADNSVITLFLDDTYTLSSLTIRGGELAVNSIPGNLSGATFDFGGGSATLLSTGINPACSGGRTCDDFFSFAGTDVAGRSGSTITLRNITSSSANYNISEINVLAVPSTTVPEPASVALMAAGLGALGIAARRRTTR